MLATNTASLTFQHWWLALALACHCCPPVVSVLALPPPLRLVLVVEGLGVLCYDYRLSITCAVSVCSREAGSSYYRLTVYTCTLCATHARYCWTPVHCRVYPAVFQFTLLQICWCYVFRRVGCTCKRSDKTMTLASTIAFPSVSRITGRQGTCHRTVYTRLLSSIFALLNGAKLRPNPIYHSYDTSCWYWLCHCL